MLSNFEGFQPTQKSTWVPDNSYSLLSPSIPLFLSLLIMLVSPYAPALAIINFPVLCILFCLITLHTLYKILLHCMHLMIETASAYSVNEPFSIT